MLEKKVSGGIAYWGGTFELKAFTCNRLHIPGFKIEGGLDVDARSAHFDENWIKLWIDGKEVSADTWSCNKVADKNSDDGKIFKLWATTDSPLEATSKGANYGFMTIYTGALGYDQRAGLIYCEVGVIWDNSIKGYKEYDYYRIYCGDDGSKWFRHQGKGSHNYIKC